MDLIVDGLVYSFGVKGGISRIYSEILPIMCDLDPALDTKLILYGKSFGIPHHSQITFVNSPSVEKIFRPWRLWNAYYPSLRQVLIRSQLGFNRMLWHSTYYSLPVVWKGPIVISAYDFIQEKFPEYFPNDDGTIKQKSRALARADAVICISNTTKTDLIDLYNLSPEIARVIHLGYSKAFRVKDKYLLSHSRPFILYVGIRNRYKRFVDLLISYSRWSMKSQIDIVAVGPAWTGPEIDQIKSLNLQNNVHLLSQVDDETLCDLYNQAEAFVSTSLYEGFGIPLLEAMACGCPLVAARIPSTEEVASSIPLYYEPGQCDDLLAALNQALFEGKNNSRINNGLEHVKKFSWENTAQQTLQLYKSLV